MPLLHAVAAVNDGNDPSLESCSSMAALVAVNTLNDNDVSLSTTMIKFINMSPKECTLLIPVTTSSNAPLHVAPIQHTSRVTAAIAIMVVDLADLHSHLPKKSTFLTLNIHEFP